MKIKCGRCEYDIVPSDVILDNGAIIQILNRVSLNCSTIKIARGTFNRLLKDNKIEFVKHEDEMVIGGLNYYRVKEATPCKTI